MIDVEALEAIYRWVVVGAFVIILPYITLCLIAFYQALNNTDQ